MGYDDGIPTVHKDINFEMFPGGPHTRVRYTEPQRNDIHFTGFVNGNKAELLIITDDGKLIPGVGLATDVCTQKVAAKLVEHFAIFINRRILDLEQELRQAEDNLGKCMLQLAKEL